MFEDMLQFLSNNIKRKNIIEDISDPLQHSPANPPKRVKKDWKNFIKLFQGDEIPDKVVQDIGKVWVETFT